MGLLPLSKLRRPKNFMRQILQTGGAFFEEILVLLDTLRIPLAQRFRVAYGFERAPENTSQRFEIVMDGVTDDDLSLKASPGRIDGLLLRDNSFGRFFLRALKGVSIDS